jgi:transposase
MTTLKVWIIIKLHVKLKIEISKVSNMLSSIDLSYMKWNLYKS